MSIEFDDFWDWAVDRFGQDNVIRRGREVCINSPFLPDYDPDRGNHLQCNPDKNAYHCFKSDSHGNLFQLVQEFDGCSFPEAVDRLGGAVQLARMEEKLERFFAEKVRHTTIPVTARRRDILNLPPATHLISALRPDSPLRTRAEQYLAGRRIPVDGLYYCVDGRYQGRIVIPYYGPTGHLIYFNCRDITGRAKIRYLGPPKEVGVGKGDVVWVKEWPVAGSTIYITEGEFDAMSLWQSELCGAAIGGKNLSEKQTELLKPYNVVFCLDFDKYGQEALNKVGAAMRSLGGRADDGRLGSTEVSYVKPPNRFKDWNEMLVEIGAPALHYYVKECKQALTFDDLVRLRLLT